MTDIQKQHLLATEHLSFAAQRTVNSGDQRSKRPKACEQRKSGAYGPAESRSLQAVNLIVSEQLKLIFKGGRALKFLVHSGFLPKV